MAPSAFTPVESVFSGNCVGCHNASNAAPGSSFNVAGLNLEVGIAYGQIVDIDSTELEAQYLALQIQGNPGFELGAVLLTFHLL